MPMRAAGCRRRAGWSVLSAGLRYRIMPASKRFYLEKMIVARMSNRRIQAATPALVLALLCTAGVLPAAGEADSPPVPAALQRTAWEMGPEIYSFKYEESIMDEEGVLYGFDLAWIYRPWVPASQSEALPDGGPVLGLEGRVAFGQVDYDGALSDGTPLTVDGIDDYCLETRAIFGADWLATDTMHSVYAGIGYRYLNDDLGTHPAGYERESNYLYLPVGYQIDAGLGEGWSWAARIEYDIFLWGNQRSHLNDADPSLPDVDNRQDGGFGYRASVRLQHKGADASFVIEPFVRFWDIDESEVSLGFFEPANETTEYGIQLIWMF